jgi:hypothetical protein
MDVSFGFAWGEAVTVGRPLRHHGARLSRAVRTISDLAWARPTVVLEREDHDT